MKKSIKIIFSVSCILALMTFGCKKKETTEVDNETQSAVDNAVADQEYAAVVPEVQNYAINTKGTGTSSGKIMAACDSLVKISGDVNFGMPGHVHPTYTMNVSSTYSCVAMNDSKLRTGVIQITLTNKIKIPGAKMIIKMLGYKTGAIGYSCDSMVVTTLANDSALAMIKFNVKLFNGICQSPSWTIKYSSDRTTTHYAKGNPYGTIPVSEVFGTSNGINRQGRAFTVSIPQSTPLIKHKGCQFIDKGIMTLTPEGFKERIVNFGPGTCEDDATFTVNGNTVAFKLK